MKTVFKEFGRIRSYTFVKANGSTTLSLKEEFLTTTKGSETISGPTLVWENPHKLSAHTLQPEEIKELARILSYFEAWGQLPLPLEEPLPEFEEGDLVTIGANPTVFRIAKTHTQEDDAHGGAFLVEAEDPPKKSAQYRENPPYGWEDFRRLRPTLMIPV